MPLDTQTMKDFGSKETLLKIPARQNLERKSQVHGSCMNHCPYSYNAYFTVIQLQDHRPAMPDNFSVVFTAAGTMFIGA